MKNLKILIFIFASSLTSAAFGQKIKDTSHWINPSSKIQAVFSSQNGSQRNETRTEILKLYRDNSYEFLVYVNSRIRSIMTREVGSFTLNGSRLKLIKPKKSNLRSANYLDSYTFISGKGVYSSLLKSVFQKNKFQMLERKKTEFDFPFYIDPSNHTIVDNKEALKKIDLKDLAINITKNKTTERDKMMAIINFIKNSIEYDYPGYYSGTYANNQGDSKSILAGKRRIAVCAGYAHVFRELCLYAGLSCREVIGRAKNSINDIAHYGMPHAWNIITINGKEELYDITWADGAGDSWLNLNPAVMIYTHFPDKVADQLLANPISKDDFNNAPFINPTSSFQSFNDFSPKSGVVYTDSVFQFIIHSKVSKININVNEANSVIFDVVYNSEGFKKQSFCLTPVVFTSKQNKNGETIITIPIKKAVSAIYISIDGCEYCYKVINGDRERMLKIFQGEVKRQILESYIKGVLASIALNDAAELKKLVGADNVIFFDKKSKINKEVINKFKNWDGNLSGWKRDIRSPRLKEIAGDWVYVVEFENIIYAGKYYFVFDKVDDGYVITSVN